MEIDDTKLDVEKATSQIFARALRELNNSTGNARTEVRSALLKAARHISASARQTASSMGVNLRASAMKNNVASYTRSHPFVMLGGAFVAGLMISQALHRAKRKTFEAAASHEEE